VIDFTLSNCLNSGLRRIHVLTQYKSGSLERHVRIGWGPIFHHELDEWIQCVPPQLRVGQRWYQGTADAVYQNVYLLDQDRPRLVLVLSGDHVYKMDYAKMIEAHETSGALATVAAIEVPVGEASAFGVIAVDEQSRITAFQEKPKSPAPIPAVPKRLSSTWASTSSRRKPSSERSPPTRSGRRATTSATTSCPRSWTRGASTRTRSTT
jgi:glucose-1-phosphate adenylyltransferase